MGKPPAQQPDDLSRLLRTWEIDPVNDPQLARKVWQRLGAERPSPWRTWIEALARLLAQPVAASAAVFLFAAVGAGVAELSQSSAREQRLAQLAAEYARSIDPVLMHGDAPSAPSAHAHTP